MLREHLAKAQNKMKMTADKKRVDKEYQVGDMVLLKLQPYAQSSLVNRPFPKLSFKYFGPYKVTHKIGRAAYQLDLPTSSQLHPVFHVSQLKSFLPNYTPVFSDLPKVAELDGQDLYPEAVLERRLVKKGNKASLGQEGQQSGSTSIGPVGKVTSTHGYMRGLVCSPRALSRRASWWFSKFLGRGEMS